MLDDEQLPVSLVLDPPDGTLQDPKWTSSDENIFTVVVAPDSMSAKAVSVTGARGVATLSFNDAGATPLSASMDIPVMGRPQEATGVSLVAGVAEPK